MFVRGEGVVKQNREKTEKNGASDLDMGSGRGGGVI